MATDLSGWDSRTRRLVGDAGCEALAGARVLVVGIGGVGGYAVEMLARSGVGELTLVDADAVDVSNLNRQIIATIPALGEAKTDVMARRIADINPECRVISRREYLTVEDADALLDGGYDYVLDCIDTVAPKVALLAACQHRGVKVISSMGAGGRIDPSKTVITDLWETTNDGLARAVRQRLRKAGLRRRLPVVASTELPHTASLIEIGAENKRTSYGTIAPLPATFGIFMASYVINDLISE